MKATVTPEAENAITDVAQRHGLSREAVLAMLYAIHVGGGTMAQFSIPELGGSGQWMQGGMTMVGGNMFDNALRARVDALCTELAQLLATASVFPPSANWWPANLGVPSAAGGQNTARYAIFPLGVDPDSVDVSVDGGILTVTAQRSERTEHDVQWLSSERFTGGYLRRLSLGQDIDADHIAATYQNGVLTVTLPVATRAKPRRIEITPGAREETKLIEPSDSSDQHTTT